MFDKIDIKHSEELVDYNDAVVFMEQMIPLVSNNSTNSLIWFLEHKEIYTLGTNSKENEIINKYIPVIKTNRAGKITYHCPGQRIIYFVFLLKINFDVFIEIISSSILSTLKYFSINSFFQRDPMGIWIDFNKEKYKFASFGFAIKQRVIYHGIAININNKTNNFRNIMPCGMSSDRIKSLSELGYNIDIKLFDSFKKRINEVFYSIINY